MGSMLSAYSTQNADHGNFIMLFLTLRFVDIFSKSQGYKIIIKSIGFGNTSKLGGKRDQCVVCVFDLSLLQYYEKSPKKY